MGHRTGEDEGGRASDAGYQGGVLVGEFERRNGKAEKKIDRGDTVRLWGMMELGCRCFGLPEIGSGVRRQRGLSWFLNGEREDTRLQ